MSVSFRAAYTSDPRNVALAREAVAKFARLCGFEEAAVADIRLAAGEALSNAAEHGLDERRGGFSIRCEFDAGVLTVEIQDSGRGFHPAVDDCMPPDPRGRGFGIFLMRRLMDSVTFARNGTCVRLTRRIAG